MVSSLLMINVVVKRGNVLSKDHHINIASSNRRIEK